MSQRRISDFGSLSAATLSAAEDLLHVVDKSEAIDLKDKKITAECFAWANCGNLPIPYLYKEEFKVHTSDIHQSHNAMSLHKPIVWVAPQDTGYELKARIRCWGAGGSGGSGSVVNGSGGGGGAGAFSETIITYTPGARYEVYIGRGGGRIMLVETHGVDGGDTYVQEENTGNIINLARGGKGGKRASGDVNGGTSTHGGNALEGIGNRRFDGAGGSMKGVHSLSGGTGGASYLGGRGGLGASDLDTGDARNGNFPGAGGGGGGPATDIESDYFYSGAGADGLVTIEYNNDPNGAVLAYSCGLVLTPTSTTTSTSTTSTSTTTTSSPTSTSTSTSTTSTSTTTTSTSTTTTSTSTTTTSTSTTSTSTSTTDAPPGSTSTTTSTSTTSTTSTSTTSTSTSTTTTAAPAGTSTSTTTTTSTSTTSTTSTSTTSTSSTSTTTTTTESITTTSTTSTSTTTTTEGGVGTTTTAAATTTASPTTTTASPTTTTASPTTTTASPTTTLGPTTTTMWP